MSFVLGTGSHALCNIFPLIYRQFTTVELEGKTRVKVPFQPIPSPGHDMAADFAGLEFEQKVLLAELVYVWRRAREAFVSDVLRDSCMQCSAYR